MRKWNELEFEWDEEKAAANWKNHGVRFETAAHVFEDENLMEYYDGFHSDGEERYQVIGKVKRILFVVYTERKERIRLISARKATKAERRRYLDR